MQLVLLFQMDWRLKAIKQGKVQIRRNLNLCPGSKDAWSHIQKNSDVELEVRIL